MTDLEILDHYLLSYGTFFEPFEEADGIVRIINSDKFEEFYDLKSLTEKMKLVASTEEVFDLLKKEKLPK